MGDPTQARKGGYLGKRLSHWMAMGACCGVGSVGLIGGLLLARVYYYGGGQQKWLMATLQTLGWPILLPPLFVTYYLEAKAIRRKSSKPSQVPEPAEPPRVESTTIITPHDLWLARAHAGIHFTPTLILILVAIGFLASFDNFLFAYGFSYLSLSTASLLTSSQLIFNAIFSYLIVRHRFTAGSLNAIFAICLGTALLGLHSVAADMPPHTNRTQHTFAMAAIIGAAALWGLIFPLVQLTYQSSVVRRATFCVFLEGQIVLAASATVFSLIGMAVAREFSAIREESESFEHGAAAYSMVLVASAIFYQFSFLGVMGLVFVVSSLFSSVVSNALFPIVSLITVGVFHDEFSVLKAIAVVLSIWGIVSYAYGGYLDAKRTQVTTMSIQNEDPACRI